MIMIYSFDKYMHFYSKLVPYGDIKETITKSYTIV